MCNLRWRYPVCVLYFMYFRDCLCADRTRGLSYPVQDVMRSLEIRMLWILREPIWNPLASSNGLELVLDMQVRCGVEFRATSVALILLSKEIRPDLKANSG